MGIPLFFKILSESYDDCIHEKIENIQSLFLDMNGIIHPCSSRALDENYTHKYKEKYEKKIFFEIENELKKIIMLTKPQFVYMAIDGVAPASKMKQQRSRRYKNIALKKEMDDIYDSCNIKTTGETWDKNVISPGTPFMNSLSKHLKDHIFNDPFYTNLDVILDDSMNPGEGEHKLINFIKKHEFNESKNIVIHGLDADLIMLAMGTHQNNIYLLRDQYDKNLFFDIDTMKLNIIQDFKERYFNGSSNGYIDPSKYIDIINDYIFICFFLGNDFLPHLLGIDLRYNGLNYIMDNYVQSYNLTNSTITNKDKLNTNVIKVFLSKLNNDYEYQVKKIFNKRRALRKNFKINASDDFEKYNQLLNNRPTMKNPDEDYIIYNNAYTKNWKYRYYKKACGEINKGTIDLMCENYIEGLMWVYKYYNEGCKNWTWKYEFHNGPLLCDLFHYINKNVTNINKEFVLPKNKPNHHNIQLLSILPLNSLPKELSDIVKDSSFSYLFPEDFELNTLFKRYYWECEPILPDVNIEKLKNEVMKKNKKLLKKETGCIIFKNKVTSSSSLHD